MKHQYLNIHDIYPALIIEKIMERCKIENVSFINERGESNKNNPR